VSVAAEKAAFFRIFGTSVAVLLLMVAAAPPSHAQTAARRANKHAKTHSAAPKRPAATRRTPAAEEGEKELALLSRALHEDQSAKAYMALSAFARRDAKQEFGPRAALALGYYDLSRDKADLAMGWLRRAMDDKLLREYAQFWQAQTSLALGKKEEAIEQMLSFRRDFPESVMTEQAVTSLAQTELAVGKGEDALAALEAYPKTTSKPALLLLRAQAREMIAAAKGEKPLQAAADYLDLYYRFPLNDEAKAAGERIPSLQFALGESFPGTPLQKQLARAEAFFVAGRWREARTEYEGLLPKLSGSDHERAELRVAECDVQLGASPERLTSVSLSDPDLDAERIFAISQVYRSQKLESQMLDDVDQLTKRFPQSSWAEEGLFAAGNYYWVNMDRDRAADFYRRVLDIHAGKYAPTAAWRVAWTTYLDRKPEAADLLEAYVRQFPTSSYIPDALYWLGRSYERSGNPALARIFYITAVRRFPLTYFGAKAAERVRPEPEGIGTSPSNPAEFLSVIPLAPSLPLMDQPRAAMAREQQSRAQALSDIAFDASAELEYRAAYAATHLPQFLIDAAGAAVAAGHYAAGMMAVRQLFPQLEARRVQEIPIEAWRAAFPLPYETSLRSAASRNQLDPMLVAGLIRQESAFESNAMSRAGAVGLMQVMPKTALKLARQMKVRYTRARLTDPSYNLRLGSHYLAGLIQSFGTPEAALAAYNAGEDRVQQWTSGQNYLEAAEFVESIPFTQTREYVQIVIRNAEVYQQVYGRVTTGEQQAAHVVMSGPASAENFGRVKAEGSRPVRPEAKR
jgi:peptidoglycan lytic transglycosylase